MSKMRADDARARNEGAGQRTMAEKLSTRMERVNEGMRE
jgi:hypothetical protein